MEYLARFRFARDADRLPHCEVETERKDKRETKEESEGMNFDERGVNAEMVYGAKP